PMEVDPAGRPIRVLAHSVHEGGSVTAAAIAGKQIVVERVTEETSLVGETTRQKERSVIDLSTAGDVTALAIDGRGDVLFAGTTEGEVVPIELRGSDLRPAAAKSVSKRPGAKITVLGFLLGDRTFVVGDEAGGVATWQLLRGSDGGPELTRIHDFPTYATPVAT